MPTALVRRLDLDKLYPPFLQRYLQTLADCLAAGAHYEGLLGYRSVEEQNALYAKGRSAPGPKVTNAPGGKSMHNYGLAADSARFYLVDDKWTDSWADNDYSVLQQVAPQCGLQAGAGPGIKDLDHVQVGFTAAGLNEYEQLVKLEGLYASGGLSACWAYLDSLALFK